MLLDGTYFWILNLFLLVFVINSVCTDGRSGEHVHIKLHIPEVYKKHTHVQTIVKHHFHPPPSPKQKKVHHYHHHHHSHKSKSKTNSHFHFENAPIHSSHSSSHSHYEIPTYKPKKISPIYNTEYHFAGGYKPMKSAPLKYSEESFRPSIPVYSVDEDDEPISEYSFNSDTHDDLMEEPENDYDETKTTPYYTAPSLGQQPLHTNFQSSSLKNDEDNNDDGIASQWNGLLSKKYKSNDIKLESPHDTTWPLAMPSELETYSTISHYIKPSTKKNPKFVYDSDNFELGYTNSDYSATFGSGSRGGSTKINKKWPIQYSTRLITKPNYED